MAAAAPAKDSRRRKAVEDSLARAWRRVEQRARKGWAVLGRPRKRRGATNESEDDASLTLTAPTTRHFFSCPWVPAAGRARSLAPRRVLYFEVEIIVQPGGGGGDDGSEEPAALRGGPPPCVALGLSAPGFQAGRMMPGWDAHSVGYHSDDGGVFHATGVAARHAEPFGAGDVVGCGLDMALNRVFFTKNGRSCDHGFCLDECPGLAGGELFPTVGVDHDAEIKVNFGARAFRFDLAALAVRPTRAALGPRSFSKKMQRCAS